MKMVTNRLPPFVRAGFIIGVTACASVDTLPGAQEISLFSAEQLAGCQRLGSASAQVVDKIAFVERDKEKMAKELLKLAQNEALRMGGNALRIASEIKNGSRQFEVYRC